MIIELNFEKISTTVKNFDSETSKLQPVIINLSEMSGGTAGVHQRVADSLQVLIFCAFVTTRPLKCNDILI